MANLDCRRQGSEPGNSTGLKSREQGVGGRDLCPIPGALGWQAIDVVLRYKMGKDGMGQCSVCPGLLHQGAGGEHAQPRSCIQSVKTSAVCVALGSPARPPVDIYRTESRLRLWWYDEGNPFDGPEWKPKLYS